jgi:pimeloyl-ACP methyl ester carboxylesterase
VDDERLRVCLEREIELGAVRLHVRDWPGFDGPIVHVPDPLASWPFEVAEAVARALAPRYRVLGLRPRGDQSYQADAADLLGVLEQFGFAAPVLLGERLGCLTALLVAAWHPARVARLVLLDATVESPSGDSLAARALRDCPPDWRSLRASVRCPVLELAWDEDTIARLEGFLRA